jgi:hypothetical protein
VLELGVWEGMVHRIRLADVDRLRLLVVSCFTKHAESSIQSKYELYHANMYNVKHFHVSTYYRHNLPWYVYEYVLFISIDGFVRKYNHNTRAYKYIYVLHFS